METYAAPLAMALGLLIVLDAAPARAEMPDRIGPILLPGLNLASASGRGSPTVLVGGEVSIAKMTGLTWVGGYADAVWLPTRDRVRLSLGPEFGFFIFGVDGGAVFEFDEYGTHAGLQVRPLLSFAFVHLGARFGRTFGDGGSAFQELGVLLKYPIEL